MLGIDAGGTYLKFGTFREENGILEHLNLLPLPYTKEFLTFLIESHSPVLVTGAGSQAIKAWFSPSKKIEIVPELLATGLGGAYLAHLDKCIVVNIGSGTPVLYVNRNAGKVEHLGGTGMGSASLVGLGKFLTGISNLDEISSEALKGKASKVNLLIQDIYSDPTVIGLPGNITASNFGKYQDWRHNKPETKPSIQDLLAGLHSMVGETIAVVSTLASRQKSSEGLPIVGTGGGTMNEALVRELEFTFNYMKQEYIIPTNAVYGSLTGVFVAKGFLS